MTTSPHTIGSRYHQTSDLDVAQVAKLVRSDIRDAIQAGTLPTMKVSVRISRFSGGTSIDVHLSGQDFPLTERRPDAWGMERDMLTAYARLTIADVKAIVDAYNFDDSDSLTDYYRVRFYSSVTFTS